MEELIRIRLDELSRLRDELIEKQKIDLARIEVRMEELSALAGQSPQADAVTPEMDLPFELEEPETMVLEDEPTPEPEAEPALKPESEEIAPDLSDPEVPELQDESPIVIQTPEPEPEPTPAPPAKKEINIPPILEDVKVVEPTPVPEPIQAPAPPPAAESVSTSLGQDDMEDFINGLV